MLYGIFNGPAKVLALTQYFIIYEFRKRYIIDQTVYLCKLLLFQLGGNNDSKHFLLYYYYGGMIYTAMKNYDRALYFFEVVVTVPAMVVSHIMLEAYKKYILVSLILHGKVNKQILYRALFEMTFVVLL